jgi:benzoyl-CoA-dihydrodiol lyase
LALACDEIWLVDDRSSAVSLPEVPLLGVLPGTGGLTRLTDKRKVRRDHADIFCTLTEGVRAQRAKEWRLIDGHAPTGQFAAVVRARAEALAKLSDRPAKAQGVKLPPLQRQMSANGYRYSCLNIQIDSHRRVATLTVDAPAGEQPQQLDDIIALGAQWWPLVAARELEDAILMLRTNHLEVGTWILDTQGSFDHALAMDGTLARHSQHWFVREVIGLWRRTLARLEVSSRTLFAFVNKGSCFAGTLFELALAADRIYMLSSRASDAPRVALSGMNFGAYPSVAQVSRLAARFYGDAVAIDAARVVQDTALTADAASKLGLVTLAIDELDWEQEIRIALEERASLSPDALTGLEANLRFGALETQETRIFGRLSAWQNWIFTRPNAVGEAGALKVYGTGNKAQFDRDRA